MNNMFKGVCPVINVPFFENEDIDYNSMEKTINCVLDEGCKSICLFAFNSEPHKMTNSEKKNTINKFTNIVNGRADTLIGIVENSIHGCIELACFVEECGADGIILYPPALSTPSGDDLLSYFKTIASCISIQVMIQDNPRSTGVSMSIEFLLKAFNEIDNFNYLKVECPTPVRKMKEIIKRTDGKLKCYSGNGGIFAVDAYNSGAWGIMPGASMVGYFINMLNFIETGDLNKARNIFENILPFIWYEDQSMEFYIACEKAILNKKDIIMSSKVRSPGIVLDEDEKDELFTLYNRVNSLLKKGNF